ncbi:Homeobox BEL1-like protein [Nymphaea thermarum]|nr:Homeobox BEL1-like protein [Nymphaea thermarum]
MGMEEGVLIDRGLRLRTISELSHEFHQDNHSQGLGDKSRAQIPAGYGGYSDFTAIINPGIPQMVGDSLEHPQMLNPTEIFNLQTGMELLSFPAKNNSSLRPSDVFKGFLAVNQPQAKPEQGSSSKPSTTTTTNIAYHQQELPGRYQEDLARGSSVTSLELTNQGLIINGQPDYHHPAQQRQSRHGLSLSLSPHNPSELRVQSFESAAADDLRYGLAYRGAISRPSFPSQYRSYELKNSKYLPAAQELLYEFCNLGTKRQPSSNIKKNKNPSIEDSTPINPSLYAVDFLELQKRKCKLVAMLEEVDRRYKQYCEQMRGVVASFETVVGQGAADVYSSLASRAMSKHFRCLRDGIVAQIKATKKVLGEKDAIAPGTTKGETPRLRLLDQSLRQQKAYQNMGMMENHPWRPQRGLPERSVSILRAWLFEHFLHPYPSDVDKHILARQTGLSRSQVSNWFINARVRLWKPMVEEMYLEEAKEKDKRSMCQDKERNPSLQPQQATDEPPPPTLLRDSDSLSSIINGDEAKRKAISSTTTSATTTATAANITAISNLKSTNDGVTTAIAQMKSQQQQAFGSVDSYDFVSSYQNDNSSSSQRQYANNGGVSLTLGLHQHNANSSAYQHPLFFPRDGSHLDECNPLHFSVLDDGEAVQGNSAFGPQSLSTSYRSGHLVGTQLLHDFVG